ncbi:hypothetical protein [Agromyces aureus]|uniref:hypothetical protein n=1 Tax=Agromyces aureus TaxID=453304 RepID=UPI000B30702C|nr:hypothetical protein [Agromyces aureus]
MKDDPHAAQRDEQDLQDEAVAAAEQHQHAEEEADADEQVVVRDAGPGETDERPAQ